MYSWSFCEGGSRSRVAAEILGIRGAFDQREVVHVRNRRQPQLTVHAEPEGQAGDEEEGRAAQFFVQHRKDKKGGLAVDLGI